MQDFKVLKFLDRFEKSFDKIGVDYRVMRRILSVRLTLDSRRVSTVFMNEKTKKRKEDSEDKNNFMKSLWLYGFFGLFQILFMVMGENFLFQMNLVFGILMFLLMTTLIADFSAVLLDVKDKEILMSKPVDSKTYNIAKMLHIFFYVGAITMALSGPSLIVGMFKQGIIFTIIYALAIILIALFTIVITALIYLFILRFSSGEKLKDIINYVQIGLAIAMSIGYQLISRVFDVIDIENMTYIPSLWKYLLPSVWFAALFELVLNKNYQIYIIIYSVLAVLVPVISIAAYIKLMPTFEKSLQKLNSAEGQTKDRDKMVAWVSKIVCSSKEERIFYKFATRMLKNERTFKLKVYPNLGFSIILPFIMILNINQNELLNIGNTKSYMWIYISFLMVPTTLVSLGFSGHYKGAWIYKTMPIQEEGAIRLGAIKAAIMNLFVPVFVISSLIYLFIYKFTILDHLFVAGINLLLFTWIIYKLGDKGLPFSEKFAITERNIGFLETLLHMVIIGLFGLVHYLVGLLPYGIYGYMVIALVAMVVRSNKKRELK